MKRLILILILPLFLFGGLLDSLQHVWKFENTYNDTVGTDTLKNYNTTFTTGIDGNSVDFNGTNSYLTDSLYSDFSWTDTMSYSFWINADFDRTTTTDNSFLCFEETSANKFLIYWNDSPLGFRLFSIDGASNAVVPDTLIDIWTHVFFKRVPNDSNYIYVNGEKIISQSIAFISGISQLSFGVNATGGSFFNGQMDEVYIWNRDLSDEEIQSLADSTFYPFAEPETDTFLIDWNGIDLDLIDTWNGIDIDLIQSINGVDLK